MAIRNSSYTRSALSALILVTLTACQTAGKHTTPATHTPPATTGGPSTAPQSPPAPTREEAKKVAVILGPGGAKALAHVGVLKAFQRERVPVDKIVGLEWGALVAGLYASKGQVNDVEWKLYKMEQKGLPRPKGFFSRKLGDDSVKVMDEFLSDAFAKEDFAGAHVPFACPMRSLWTGVVAWQNRGLLKDAVKRCLPFPPLFRAQGSFVAGASQASEAIDLLRREGYNVIILVNVLGSALPVPQDGLLDNLNYVILWQEIKRELSEASKYGVEVVNVDTSAIPMVQFESKKDLIGLGEAAGETAARQLVNKYSF